MSLTGPCANRSRRRSRHELRDWETFPTTVRTISALRGGSEREQPARTDKETINNELTLPETVAAFVAYDAIKSSASTLRRRLAGIRMMTKR